MNKYTMFLTHLSLSSFRNCVENRSYSVEILNIQRGSQTFKHHCIPACQIFFPGELVYKWIKYMIIYFIFLYQFYDNLMRQVRLRGNISEIGVNLDLGDPKLSPSISTPVFASADPFCDIFLIIKNKWNLFKRQLYKQ